MPLKLKKGDLSYERGLFCFYYDTKRRKTMSKRRGAPLNKKYRLFYPNKNFPPKNKTKSHAKPLIKKNKNPIRPIFFSQFRNRKDRALEFGGFIIKIYIKINALLSNNNNLNLV
jgi:hypothetical protein